MLTPIDLRKHLNLSHLTDEQLQEMLECLDGLANTMISMYLSEEADMCLRGVGPRGVEPPSDET